MLFDTERKHTIHHETHSIQKGRLYKSVGTVNHKIRSEDKSLTNRKLASTLLYVVQLNLVVQSFKT